MINRFSGHGGGFIWETMELRFWIDPMVHSLMKTLVESEIKNLQTQIRGSKSFPRLR